ncbi:hypothetical protein N7461_005420 [Penicillium sp. DV-2018c]|nr:hypothetical protein N7461_005420 [Penicillium sp. DV-2018c]
MSSPAHKKASDDEMRAQQSEYEAASILGEIDPDMEVEVEIRYPVQKGDELYYSDPEEGYRGYSEVTSQLLRRRSSFHNVTALIEVQGEAVSSPSTNPPSTRSSFSSQITTNNSESGTDQSCSNPSSDSSGQTRAKFVVAHKSNESPKKRKKTPKKKKQERRKRKQVEKRAKSRESLELTLTRSSSGHGVDDRLSSSHGSSRDERGIPRAMQLGSSETSSASFLDLRTVGVRCAKVDCEVVCGYADGVSVLCPGCGPFSYVRYCGKQHLWEDAKAHWLYCGKASMREVCLAISIPYDVLVGPPMLPNLHNVNFPERHRQALWFSTASDLGDYFLFTDWTDLKAAKGQPKAHLELRCSSRVAYTVRFEDATEKDKFRRCLAICLFAALEYPDVVDYVYRSIRDWLIAHNFWASDNNVDAMLVYQLGLEFHHEIEPSCRHACEAEWVGPSPWPCEDPICLSERHPTPSDGWCLETGLRGLCDSLEYDHWILRAHRTTHPTVSEVVARTCGIGFPGVVAEDRRLFRRGEGWDGVGAGPMELRVVGSESSDHYDDSSDW